MDCNPDSSLSLLNTIATNSLTSKELPYYALLYTQAQFNNDIFQDSDSLMKIAYNKFSNITKGDFGIRSNFYMGEISFNRFEYNKAMRYYLSAYDESNRQDLEYWHALSALRISELFFHVNNFYEKEAFSSEAIELLKKMNKPIDLSKILSFHSRHLLDSVRALRSFNVFDPSGFHQNIDQNHVPYAIASTDSFVFIKGYKTNDSIQKSLIQTQKDHYTQSSHILQQKNSFLRFLIYLGCMIFLMFISLLIIMIYTRNLSLKEKIETNLETILELRANTDRINIENAQLEECLKEKVNAINILNIRIKESHERMASLNSELDRKDILVEQMQYNLKKQCDEIRNISVLLNEKNIAYENILLTLEQKTKQEANQIQITEKLFKEKWTTLDMLCNQYFGLLNSEINEKNILTKLEKEIKKIVSKKGIDEIVDAVDLNMGKIITRLREQCPFLKEEDTTFLGLLYAGFSVRSICLFTNVKYQHFYVKKSRLIKRIKGSNVPDKEEFISKLE